jgi:hypothetical protein
LVDTIDNAAQTEHQDRTRRDATAALLAAIALLLVFGLALIAREPLEKTLADRLTLAALGVAALICFWTPLLAVIEAQQNAASFALTAAMFVVYGLARRAGPAEGFGLHFAALPEDRFVISYAAWVVIVAAVVAVPLWPHRVAGWTRAVLAALLLIGVLAGASFLLLSARYEVGPDKIVDPGPLPTLGLQLVEYAALALLCNIAAGHPPTRRLVLRALPVLLLALAARMHVLPAPAEEE